MGEVHYMISEAAKRVGVENHVLRYWEEELNLIIGRTEMGHRYYTEENIQLFNCIKELKEQGILLKDLRTLIPDILHTKKLITEKKNKPMDEKPTSSIQQALLENNKLLEASISHAVSKAVITEMDFLLQAKERQEEERYKKLDYLIRQQQSIRKESSRTSSFKSLRRIFGT